MCVWGGGGGGCNTNYNVSMRESLLNFGVRNSIIPKRYASKTDIIELRL